MGHPLNLDHLKLQWRYNINSCHTPRNRFYPCVSDINWRWAILPFLFGEQQSNDATPDYFTSTPRDSHQLVRSQSPLWCETQQWNSSNLYCRRSPTSYSSTLTTQRSISTSNMPPSLIAKPMSEQACRYSVCNAAAREKLGAEVKKNESFAPLDHPIKMSFHTWRKETHQLHPGPTGIAWHLFRRTSARRASQMQVRKEYLIAAADWTLSY